VRLARDTWIVFLRYLGILGHNPAWIVIGAVQPALYLLLFAPLLKSLAALPGFPPGGAYNVFVPGLLVQLGLFGAAGVGFSLISEVRFGVMERLRVTPVHRAALFLGRAARDVLVLVLQAVILLALALPFGLRARPVGVLLVLALVALIGLMMAAVAYTLALALRSEDAYAPLVFSGTLPLLLLSGVLLPLTLAPGWLRDLARANPLYYAVNAARGLFNGHVFGRPVWIGLTLMLALVVLTGVVAVRAFRRSVA
jgi:ABC-2 type transport system permease protein